MRLVRLGVGAAIVAAFAFPLSAHAAITPYAAVEVAPARLELPVTDSQQIHRTFTVANLSRSAETVHVEVADFTIANATYQVLPSGSTPWSIAAGLSLSTTDLLLQPQAQATVALAYAPLTQTSVRAGALLFTPTLTATTSTPTGSGLIIKQRVMVPVLAVPAGLDGSLDTRVSLTAAPAGIDLPSAWFSFQESGPILARASFRNTGDALARFDTWFTYSNLGRDFLSVESPPGAALPGQTAQASATTRLQLPGQAAMADTAPMFCVCRVHASSSLVLLGQRGPETAQDRLVIVAPWRLLGLFLAVLLGVLWGTRRRFPFSRRSA